MAANKLTYVLEVIPPEDKENPDLKPVAFESETPFMTFAKGDLISPHMVPKLIEIWEKSAAISVLAKKAVYLTVTEVRHIIYEEKDTLKHKVVIATSETASSSE